MAKLIELLKRMPRSDLVVSVDDRGDADSEVGDDIHTVLEKVGLLKEFQKIILIENLYQRKLTVHVVERLDGSAESLLVSVAKNHKYEIVNLELVTV